MKTYNIIDTTERNAKAELKRYTWEQVLDQFRPVYDEDYPESSAEAARRFSEVNSLYSLREYLEWEAQGMRIHFKIEEDMERWNRGIALAR